MRVGIVAGGPTFANELFRAENYDYVIGVDFGAKRLLDADFPCDIAVGDFDSISPRDFKMIQAKTKLLQFPPEKDATDLELALDHALSLNPQRIDLYGVMGGRVDHFLGVLALYQRFLSIYTELWLIDKQNRIHLLKPGRTEILKSDYRYISFFSYHEMVKGLTLTGFKYPLNEYNLNNQSSITISNEIVTTGIVEFRQGYLLVVESKD